MSQLLEEMTELAVEAVSIKEQLEDATDLQTQIDLQNELDIINQRSF